MGYLEKRKRRHLTGKKLRELNKAVHLRDENRCINCGRPVDGDDKFHHEPCGIYKSDEIEKAVTLCRKCHYRRHNGPGAKEIQKRCSEYLMKWYGEKGARRE